MTLPRPQKKSENNFISKIGGTWIDVNVDRMFKRNIFENWGKFFRGYLRGDGKWDIAKGHMALPFFCVGSRDDHIGKTDCGKDFMENELFRGGKWAIKQTGTRSYSKFDKFNVQGIKSILHVPN